MFAIGSVSTVIVVTSLGRCCGRRGRPPRRRNRTATATPASGHTSPCRPPPGVLSAPVRAICAALVLLVRTSLSGHRPVPVVGSRRASRLLALDQPVHVARRCANSGSSFVAIWSRGGEVDGDDLLHVGRRVGQDDDPVRQVDRLVDVVGHEEDRDPVLARAPAGPDPRGRRASAHRPRRTARPSAGSRAGRRGRGRSRRAAACRPRAATGSGRGNRVSPTASSASRRARSAPLRESFLCRSGSRTLLRTDVQGISERLYSWKTSAISSGGAGDRAAVAATTSPRVGCSSPAMHLSSVVLPHPDGPTTQTNSPALDRERDVAERLVAFRAAAVRLADVADLQHRPSSIYTASPRATRDARRGSAARRAGRRG